MHESAAAEHHDDIIYPETFAFLLVHLACLGALWTGVNATSVAIAVSLYLIRMFSITAGFHRYFSHRSFKTSRVFQFVLAFMSQTSAQKGVLWWSAKHREHHRHSDTELDVHSPGQKGFWFAHLGWIFSRSRQAADYRVIPDLTRYPELVWLDRYDKVPAFLMALGAFLVAGWPGLVVGFFWSTVVLYHGTFFINSLAHVVGRQRYVTGDDSRNNWWLALITLGEGWHNNHHFYQASTRQGFRWWEIDITYYGLKMLSWVGIVWDLKAPPAEVVRGERALPRPVVDKVARQLAGSFPTASISARIREAWVEKPGFDEMRARFDQARTHGEAFFARIHLSEESAANLEELRRRAVEARDSAEAMLREIELPAMPSLDELRQRADEMFASTPSFDDIVERARQILVDAVSAELIGRPLPAPA